MAKAKKKKATQARGKQARPLDASDTHFLKSLGAKIKEVRLAHGLTAKQLAEAIGIKILGQFMRESGRLTMPVVDLHRYATALGIPVTDLIPPATDSAPPSKRKSSGSGSSAPKKR